VLESTCGPATATQALRANIAASKRLGSYCWELVGRCGLVCEMFAIGEWDAASDDYAEVMPLVVEEGWAEEVAILHSVRALLLAARGDATLASETDELAGRLPQIAAPGASDPLLSLTCLVAAAALRHVRGQGDEVARLLRECLEGDYIRPWGPACEGYRAGVLPWAVRLALTIHDEEVAVCLAGALKPLTALDEHAAVYMRGLLAEHAAIPRRRRAASPPPPAGTSSACPTRRRRRCSEKGAAWWRSPERPRQRGSCMLRARSSRGSVRSLLCRRSRDSERRSRHASESSASDRSAGDYSLCRSRTRVTRP
jgi:hypothetical protein